MSADLLRRAAAKIRETARAAQRELDELLPEDPPDLSPWNATERHIALWSPEPALLVAYLLDDAARRLEEVHEGTLAPQVAPLAVATQIAIARLILKEES